MISRPFGHGCRLRAVDDLPCFAPTLTPFFVAHGARGCTQFPKLNLELVPPIAAEVQASMCCFCEADDLLHHGSEILSC